MAPTRTFFSRRRRPTTRDLPGSPDPTITTGPGKPGLPATDAFTTLGGLARETRQVRLGVLVSPITFRHPAVIAKSAASIDEMSGGRFDLGVGTGWMEAEHTAFGLPFPPRKERFDRLTESLQYLRAAFDGGSFEGRYYSFKADAEPRPSGIRLLVGGSGPEKTPTLAGRFADEYNHSAIAPDKLAAKIEVMKEAAREAGRNPDEITVSVMGPAMLAPPIGRLSELMTAAAAFRNVSVTELEERWNSARVPPRHPRAGGRGVGRVFGGGSRQVLPPMVGPPDRAGIAEQVELRRRVEALTPDIACPPPSGCWMPPVTLGLDLEIHQFPDGTKTAADAAAAIGCPVAAIVKSLVFVVGEDPVLALVPGDLMLDLTKLEAVAGSGPARRATLDEVRSATGFAAGGTPPFGHVQPIRVFADEALRRNDPVWAAGGTPTTVFPISLRDLDRSRARLGRPELVKECSRSEA